MACANADTPAGLLTQDAAEAAVLCLINEERAAAGVAPLTLNLKLRAAARQHANDARTIKWWAGGGPKIHTNPITRSTPKDRIRNAGYCSAEGAPPTNENGYNAYYQGGIQYATGTTPQAAVTWWMGSPGHRRTLLDPTYNESGVAVVLGIPETGPGPDAADGGAIFLQTFGKCLEPEAPNVGDVWNWGLNDFGQLGDGTTNNRLRPVRPNKIGPVVGVAGGGWHSLALMSDGTVAAWGKNTQGQLGDGTTTDQSSPVPVQTLNDVTALAAGFRHSLALRNNGTVWGWGLGRHGQLGDGTNSTVSSPTQMDTPVEAIAITAGLAHSLVLTSGGRVLACGDNEYGQLGDGTTTNRSTPVSVHDLSDVIAISACWLHSLALKRDGSVWGWGLNSSGQLGDGTNTNRLTPVRVHMPSRVDVIVDIAAGGFHSLALEQNGQMLAWGSNSWGTLGTGDTTDSSIPVRVENLTGVIVIDSGESHSLALKHDGTAWAWGSNYTGQLGDNTTTERSSPVRVQRLPRVRDIAGGYGHSLAL